MMRVLIVEDDAALAGSLSQWLSQEGYMPEVASAGSMAIHALDREQFDLAILDLGLPDIDGLEVLRRARGTGVPLPVLVLTARDAVEDRVRGLDLGADDYMAKPFSLDELGARVRALIRRGAHASGSRVVHGPLEIDQFGRRAWLNGEPLDLSPREWTVLQTLLRRCDRVVTKDQIIEEIAGWSGELTLNAVEVYISRLRVKLEPAGIRIRTVRGFGYMMEAFPVAS